MQKQPLIIVLEDIRSALNVGAIFRTADAAGVEELILSGITPYPPHPRIPKTALGASENVNWQHHTDIEQTIKYLKEKRYQIIAVEMHKKAVNIYEQEFPLKTALVFGNEITGVSSKVIAEANKIVSIPMLGMKESLNVATSVGISAFEIIRQWLFKC